MAKIGDGIHFIPRRKDMLGRVRRDSIIPSLAFGRTGIPSGLSTICAVPQSVAARRLRSHGRSFRRGPPHIETEYDPELVRQGHDP